MEIEELQARLLSDLSAINMPVDEIELSLRPFSKTFLGRYFPANTKDTIPKVYIYPYESERSNDFMDYQTIVETAIHEMCHHIQYTSGSFTRKKGVMHDTQFWKLYNHYIKRAIRLKILEVREDENVQTRQSVLC